jgi:lipopolysaccharide/colanic/teichoic acid biosynthesis glycosyltransferase
MLIQMPSGSPDDQPGPQNADQIDSFQAGLRRDLASAPIVSYDAVLGGIGKRAIDLTLALISAPLWAPVLLIASGVSKFRFRSEAFLKDERIGYGGRPFTSWSLRLRAPKPHVEPGAEPEPANDQTKAVAGVKILRALERLPQMLNVITGDMAVVGPSPLTRDQLEPLKSARRYYLSARPGFVSIVAMAHDGEDESSLYKIYAMNWAVSTDVLILWDALRSLRKRDELWRPSFRCAADRAAVVVRDRTKSNAA